MGICLLLSIVVRQTFTMFCLFLTDEFSVLTNLDPAFDDEMLICISKMSNIKGKTKVTQPALTVGQTHHDTGPKVCSSFPCEAS